MTIKTSTKKTTNTEWNTLQPRYNAHDGSQAKRAL